MYLNRNPVCGFSLKGVHKELSKSIKYTPILSDILCTKILLRNSAH